MRGWLYTILYNRFLTAKHRQTRRGVADALLEVAETELPGVDGGQDWAPAHRDLLPAFAALPEEQRSVVLLIEVEGVARAGRADRDGDVSPFARPRAAAASYER